MGYLEDETFLKDGHSKSGPDAEHYCILLECCWLLEATVTSASWVCSKPLPSSQR